MAMVWVCIRAIACKNLKHFLWFRLGVHRAEKKNKTCLDKMCFIGELQTDSSVVELTFILLSHVSQGDSWITCKLNYMLLI